MRLMDACLLRCTLLPVTMYSFDTKQSWCARVYSILLIESGLQQFTAIYCCKVTTQDHGYNISSQCMSKQQNGGNWPLLVFYPICSGKTSNLWLWFYPKNYLWCKEMHNYMHDWFFLKRNDRKWRLKTSSRPSPYDMLIQTFHPKLFYFRT